MHVHRTTMPGFRGEFAYLTRFCVHSRSRFVSLAVLRPSEKFARAPFSRRWASACSSSSSCCFAFSWPDLQVNFAVSFVFEDLGISSWVLFCEAQSLGGGDRCGEELQMLIVLHGNSRLRLSCQTLVQLCWIKCILHAVA